MTIEVGDRSIGASGSASLSPLEHELQLEQDPAQRGSTTRTRPSVSKRRTIGDSSSKSSDSCSAKLPADIIGRDAKADSTVFIMMLSPDVLIIVIVLDNSTCHA
jgi:hypothetical protein